MISVADQTRYNGTWPIRTCYNGTLRGNKHGCAHRLHLNANRSTASWVSSGMLPFLFCN